MKNHLLNVAIYLERQCIPALPKTGGHRPRPVQICRWDKDEIYEGWKSYFLSTRKEVLSLVETKKTQKGWPRGKYATKFWLLARYLGAAALCRYLAKETHNQVTNLAEDFHSKVCQATEEYILQECMDKLTVDLWLQIHMDDLVWIDDQKYDDPEDIVDAKKWIQDVENGLYLPDVAQVRLEFCRLLMPAGDSSYNQSDQAGLYP